MSFSTTPLSPAACRLVILCTSLGLLLQGAGMLVSLWAYQTPYSCLNHFISELGWPERTALPWAFNGSLIVGSLLYVPLLFSLALMLRTRLSRAATAVGLLSILAASGVGCFPIMQHLRPHLWSAFFFFIGWGLTALLFTICFARLRPRFWPPIWASLFGFCAAAAFTFFPKGNMPQVLQMLRQGPRPEIWLPAILEWLVLISFYLWLLAMTLWIWRLSRPPEVESR